MSLIRVNATARVRAAIGVFAFLLWAAADVSLAAPSGDFLAVLNERRDVGDSMNSVTFFDARNPLTPLFSVYIGREPGGPDEWEEPTALTVDPATGDIYLVAFDDGPAGVDDASGDTQGDLDLLKINVAAIYQHWAGNFSGRDVRSMSLVSGPAPTGVNNSTNLDYVTYANTLGDFNTQHSNQFALSGAVEKIGQVNRGNGGDSFPFGLEFIDQQTLFLLDDSIGLASAEDIADDHTLRLIERVSTSPGMAASEIINRGGLGTNYLNGGYNGSGAQAATQSWGSRVAESVGATGDEAFLMLRDHEGHSEPTAFAYYEDPLTPIRGSWVAENDSFGAGGDVYGFVEFPRGGRGFQFRPMITFAHPLALPLSNDPALGEDEQGKIDNLFVDLDTGDLIFIESGFMDSNYDVGPDHEPGVLRIPTQMDKGTGQIGFGDWLPKVFLNPTKDVGDTALISGAWSIYDSATDTVYFFSPSGDDSPPGREMNIYALDLTTGLTTSYLNVDDGVGWPFGGNFGDKAVFFRLSTVPEPHSAVSLVAGLLAATAAIRRRRKRVLR